VANLALAVSPLTTIDSTGKTFGRSGVAPGDLVGFIRRLAELARNIGQAEITALISGPMAALLGIPLKARGTDGAFLEPVRVAGWRPPKSVHAVLTFTGHATLPNVFLAVAPWMESELDEHPLFIPGDIVSTVSLFAQWHDATGLAYRGPAGMHVAGMTVAHYPADSKKKPVWNPKGEVPFRATDDPAFSTRSWCAPGIADPAKIDRVQLDTNSAYLAVMQSIAIARWSLRPTGPLVYDETYAKTTLGKDEKLRRGFYHRVLAGQYKIRVGDWKYDWIPHPAGPGSKPGEEVWRSGETLRLLLRLAADGYYETPDILDSYTSRGSQILRPVMQKLIHIIHSGEFPAPLVEAAKRGAQHFHGLLNKEGSLIGRAEWYSDIRAGARSILWNRSFNSGIVEGTRPAYYKVDAAFYPADNVPSEKFFPRSTGIGKFNPSKEILLKAGTPIS
jgi:hypothetical protein